MGVGRSSSLRTTAERSPLHDVRQHAPRDRRSTRYKFRCMDECSGAGSVISINRHSTQNLGGARRDRTDDLLLAKQALSQLSYGPIGASLERMSLKNMRLRKAHSIKWWAWEDLNFRPHAYQARALTN